MVDIYIEDHEKKRIKIAIAYLSVLGIAAIFIKNRRKK
tara:strand:+ start:635 stop:748 length:114 start_codon:yes stop_codon:yes gene_type:complete